jgi:hypothetical protein
MKLMYHQEGGALRIVPSLLWVFDVDSSNPGLESVNQFSVYVFKNTFVILHTLKL